jgi:adenylate cyclase
VVATFVSAEAPSRPRSTLRTRSARSKSPGTAEDARGRSWGRPRRLGGDYLGVDVNVAARVADRAKAGHVVVSDAVLERLDTESVRASKPKRLRAKRAPRELRTVAI